MRAVLVLTLAAISLAGCSFNPDTDLPQPPRASDISASLSAAAESALRLAAEKSFTAWKNAGKPLENGPCLNNGTLIPDWVIDVAHDPRLAIDDLPENQCAWFREGKSRHVIEVTPQGKVIRLR